MKTSNNKIPVPSVFNDSEGLYRSTVCRCLVRRPHYSARLMRFGSRGPSEFFFSDTPPKCSDRDCVERHRSGTRHGNVYRSLGQKQAFTSSNIELCFVSLVFRGHDHLKIANINPQQGARLIFAMEKMGSPRKRRKWSLGLR